MSREEEMNKLLIEHEVMWEEMQCVHRDFWTARHAYYHYLITNSFIELEDFHMFKMVLGKREGK